MREEISQLVDGELDRDRVNKICQQLREPEWVQTWVSYHVIGECLRDEHTVCRGLHERFVARLAAEPTVLAPRPRTKPMQVVWALAASVVAVSFVGWIALQDDTINESLPIARLIGDTQPKQVRRAAAINDYLIVHQEYSPATAIQDIRPQIRHAVSVQSNSKP